MTVAVQIVMPRVPIVEPMMQAPSRSVNSVRVARLHLESSVLRPPVVPNVGQALVLPMTTTLELHRSALPVRRLAIRSPLKMGVLMLCAQGNVRPAGPMLQEPGLSVKPVSQKTVRFH